MGTFFGAAAVSAFLGGRLADWLGGRNYTIFAGLGSAAGGFGVAWAAHSWVTMLGAMVWLGIVNAACQVTSNVTMARALPTHRRGLGFGIKQSSTPFAIAIAGLAVPVLGTDAGWRATFVATGCCGLVVAFLGRRLPRRRGRSEKQAVSRERPPRIALMTATLAVTCASAAANSLGAFIASWAHHVGLTLSQAGLLMAVGSALNIIARISGGLLADRRAVWDFPVVALQMSIGGQHLRRGRPP